MKPDIYWIPLSEFRLAIMPRPRAGDWLEDELRGWRAAGIDTVLSLLEPAECTELGLNEEAALCAGAGMEFLSFPVPDRGVPPSMPTFAVLIDRLFATVRAGRSLAIHCRAGIGRSGIAAGCLLGRLGVPHDAIFPTLSRARGLPVPDTTEQERWVYEFLRYAHRR